MEGLAERVSSVRLIQGTGGILKHDYRNQMTMSGFCCTSIMTMLPKRTYRRQTYQNWVKNLGDQRPVRKRMKRVGWRQSSVVDYYLSIGWLWPMMPPGTMPPCSEGQPRRQEEIRSDRPNSSGPSSFHLVRRAANV